MIPGRNLSLYVSVVADLQVIISREPIDGIPRKVKKPRKPTIEPFSRRLVTKVLDVSWVDFLNKHLDWRWANGWFDGSQLFRIYLPKSCSVFWIWSPVGRLRVTWRLLVMKHISLNVWRCLWTNRALSKILLEMADFLKHNTKQHSKGN